MLTCKSPRKVMRVAHQLACQTLPAYTSKFSRKDFTLPQLFACLVLREHQKKSYRGVEALLRDARHWCRAIGMRKVPDHNTLCRAFHALNFGRCAGRLLDVLAQWFAVARQLGSMVAIDSTHYDTHHRSRHYEQRCRHFASHQKNTANARRSRSARRTPKLAIAVDTASHVILAARARTGMGADYRDFPPLLQDARRRRGPGLKTALADPGYDSESNHRWARQNLRVRSLIQTGSGRPTPKPPSTRYRRLMHRQLAGSQKGKPYGQRAQSETAHSMMKRNLSDALRARSPRARRHEQLLRSITHDVMLFPRRSAGSRQSRCDPVSPPFPAHALPAADRVSPDREDDHKHCSCA
jgi:Transposase DDE domain